ncbi:MAG: hypothetical protein KA371_00230 [Acidobacteria bacterium]|nr:hypothetical protein [Acidobacteriota bacterium]
MQQWRIAVVACVAAIAAPAAVAGAQPASQPPLLRVFLTDGTSLTSFGEWVRLDDKVVFSLPLGEGVTPDLQLVTLAAGRVDWAKTERYAETVRAVHYAASRAEDDYAQFSNQVAEVLTGIAREPDPARRLAMAERARSALAEWPRQHYGYRATDVQQMLSLLDEVVSDLRAAAGQDAFELNLVSATPPLAAETLMPRPSSAQLAEELLAASTMAQSPAERTTLLERVVSLIDRAAGLLPTAWATRVRTTALGAIRSERAVDAAYTKLAASTLGRASTRTRAADVRGLERLRADTLKADQKLGAKRPAELRAMLAAIDAGAESARHLRLARDQWRLLEPVYRSYQRSVRPALAALAEAEQPLEDIRAQAGPSPADLKKTIRRFFKARPAVVTTNPPAPLASAHALLKSAWDLANSALTLRLRAVETGDPARATEASAAAAGALMLAARARDDIALAVKPPALP